MIDIYDKNTLLDFPSNREILAVLYDIDEELLDSYESMLEIDDSYEDLCTNCRSEIVKSVYYSRSYDHEDIVNDPLLEIFNH